MSSPSSATPKSFTHTQLWPQSPTLKTYFVRFPYTDPRLWVRPLEFTRKNFQAYAISIVSLVYIFQNTFMTFQTNYKLLSPKEIGHLQSWDFHTTSNTFNDTTRPTGAVKNFLSHHGNIFKVGQSYWPSRFWSP